MNPTCVVLCSVPLDNPAQADIAALKRDFAEFVTGASLYGKYPLLTFDGRGAEGGNGGGGDSSHALTFIVGEHGAGAYNFRFTFKLPAGRPATDAEIEDKFPDAARIELCHFVSDIAAAKAWLASLSVTDGGFYLSRLFKYVMLVPITPPRGTVVPGNGVKLVDI